MVEAESQQELELSWQGCFADYVTAISWLPNGRSLAVSSAAGEVALVETTSHQIQFLQPAVGTSIDCLAVSADGQFLAAGGQTGDVKIWQLGSASPTLVTTLRHQSAWVDRLAWNPISNQLAFGFGRYVQVWDADTNSVVTTLNFESSSVLSIAWHPYGNFLALGGQGGVCVWDAVDWDNDPQFLKIPSATVAIAWSPDGVYLADGNLDSTLTVIEWAQPHNPWVMQGFPGKVRQLAWSPILAGAKTPLLATCSSESIVIWRRDVDESVGWANQMLEAHEGFVQAIAFQPNSSLLASAAEDGWVCLWQSAQQLVQVLEGAPNGFSCLSWHPTGDQLAGGGRDGELLIWH